MTMLSKMDLVLLQGTIQQDLPDFEVCFKDESGIMKVLGFLAYPFNPKFMTSYITTWGKKVYFPTRNFYFGDPARSFRILAHEFVHLWDSKQHKTFKLTYMMPQVFALLPLVVFVVLAFPHSWISVLPFVSYILACGSARLSRILFWIILPLCLGGVAVAAWALTGLVSLTLLGSVLFLVPWPSPWRTRWELRGYGMNVALAQWIYGTFTQKHRESVVKQFTGPSYMFMCWSSKKVEEGLEVFRAQAVTGVLRKDHPYGRVANLLRKD